MPHSSLDRLLQTKMNRKQFLARTGAVVLTLTGASGVIKALTVPDGARTSGYGASAYGGDTRSSSARKAK